MEPSFSPHLPFHTGLLRQVPPSPMLVPAYGPLWRAEACETDSPGSPGALVRSPSTPQAHPPDAAEPSRRTPVPRAAQPGSPSPRREQRLCGGARSRNPGVERAGTRNTACCEQRRHLIPVTSLIALMGGVTGFGCSRCSHSLAFACSPHRHSAFTSLAASLPSHCHC